MAAAGALGVVVVVEALLCGVATVLTAMRVRVREWLLLVKEGPLLAVLKVDGGAAVMTGAEVDGAEGIEVHPLVLSPQLLMSRAVLCAPRCLHCLSVCAILPDDALPVMTVHAHVTGPRCWHCWVCLWVVPLVLSHAAALLSGGAPHTTLHHVVSAGLAAG